MAFFSIDDPEFWRRDGRKMDAIDAEGGMDGIALSHFVLGKPEEGAPAATILRMEPGYVLPHHAHDCYRLEFVVQGSMTAGDRTLKPGSIMFSAPGEFYGPHIAGPEGCTTVEIFSDYDGSHTTLMQSASGVARCDILTPAGAQLMMELVNQQRRAEQPA